ncbi:histidine acid phosphatase [Colletotrichum truncatum]|uniref:Histidine acid phosphatase n=1 Tax=Colletotrichum truncatum TaxID=5467 RepID=A0ACC3YID9_COLTU|nr:histidine acid phosphatase [Colletotrichum truncatum]KAF6794472.1 histidine acid phosphatase [Colletotrichum truncatum]
MTTLEPRQPYTDAELRQLYPPQLQLQLVQILLRHGERTPVTPRFQNTGLPPYWPYCRAVRHLRSAVLDPDTGEYSYLDWKRRLETFNSEDDSPIIAAGPNAELDDVCDMGMLTDRGRETTRNLGRRFRDLYVDRLNFLPANLTNADSLYLRSTPVPRALESLQQALTGLYPATHRDPALPPLTLLTRAPQDETLFPNDGNCRRFAALSRAFAQRTADRWNETPEMEYLNKKLGKWMPQGSRIAVDSRPRLSGIMDTINATRAHGPRTKLPSEFYDPKAIAIIEKIGVEEWYSGYRESQEYRTLGIGGLMGDVVARMVGSVEHTPADGDYEIKLPGAAPSPVRFGMSGCHDTTLAGVLASLGAFGTEKWPPFTSHIAIELFRDSNIPAVEASTGLPPAPAPQTGSWFSSWFSFGRAGVPTPGTAPPGIGRKPTPELTDTEKGKLDGYYVRLRYNDEPITIPGCKPTGKHLQGDESFCTLAAFKSIVDKYTPKNWKDQCRMNASAPAFPANPEPAGY